MTSRLAILAVAALAAGCADSPYIYAVAPSIVDKPDDQLRSTGRFRVCHPNGGEAEAEALARRRCAAYGFQARMTVRERYQCSVSAPHQATFACYHPDLTDEEGAYLNPFDQAAVEQWRRRTGKEPPAPPVPGWNVGDVIVRPGQPSPQVQDPEAVGAPPPAVLGPARPGPVPSAPPAAMPMWPAPEVSPPPAAPPPLPPGLEAPPGGGFSLPMGSWGDAFE